MEGDAGMSAIAPGNVAVITGSAGGIGLALAREAARRGMRVVLSDVREKALHEAARALSGEGADVIAVAADVTSDADVQALAAKAVEHFGRVNLLVNNAGAFVASLAWETPEAQLDWVIDLNFRSVARGIRAFVPRMIAQGDACHVVTVASAAGITVYPGYATYAPTKHAAVALSEALYLDLIAEGIDTIGVTIAMPGVIRTDIMVPEKTSPAALGLSRDARHANRTVRAMERVMIGGVDAAMPADAMATRVLDAVANGDLYTLPNHDDARCVGVATAIGAGRAAGTNPWRPIVESILQSMAKADTR
ncbi:short-chain dehydrogenase [Nostoc sp. 3335mG]|nr:short-chain dehydrogenase [Nostoc sp. 3335mG]